MASQTPRFGLTTLDSGTDPVNLYGYKFTGADRIALDRLLTLTEAHRHTGVAGATTRPPAPTIAVVATGGVLRPNSTVHYRYALVDDRGQEQLSSEVTAIQSPPQIPTPQPPTSLTAGPGALLGGSYSYALSYYTGTSRQETFASRHLTGQLNGTGGWTVGLPIAPSGVTGFNVYRKGPEDREFYWVALTPAASASYVDSGTPVDELHGVSRENATFSTCSTSVVIANIPTGWSVRLYRTYDAANWVDSLVSNSGVTPTATIVDTGHATQPGAPPLTSLALGAPDKIDLGGVTGVLPMKLTTPVHLVTFPFPGPVTVGYSSTFWVNEFDEARIVELRAILGVGSVPAEADVMVGLEYRSVDLGVWETIDMDTSPYPQEAVISVGDNASLASLPETLTYIGTPLVPGDALRAVVNQAGGGAVPTDTDLTVTVKLYLHHGSDVSSYVWSSV